MNDDVERVLADAGDRWQAAQPPTRPIDPELFMDDPRGAAAERRWIATPLALAGVILAVVASFAFGRLTAPGSPVGSGPGAPGQAASQPPVAQASPSAQATPSATASPSPSAPSGSPATCDVTRPDPVFLAPKPFPRTPPANYESDWYGSAHLWTMLDHDGEVWGPWLYASPPGLPQKTFWWSTDWVVRNELEPTIIVTGERLDGPGSFTFGPGTNASADFGTAMLVGIDIPSFGCWRLTAQYRLATLSYVVSVVGP